MLPWLPALFASSLQIMRRNFFAWFMDY
uniref:Uncharacterized protein n=1 Tax=Arundo donax TaxID=35708 RepID=A0A0A8YW04_ARUDO